MIMAFYSSASCAPCRRGYEYCEGKNVLSFEKKSDTEYVGIVQDSQTEPYNVRIELLTNENTKCFAVFVTDTAQNSTSS